MAEHAGRRRTHDHRPRQRSRPRRPRSKRAGYDGIFSFEGQHDPFFPLLLAAEHTERVQLTTAVAIAFAAQPDDARADRLRPAARVARPLPARPRHADQAAHREAVLDAVVAARSSACASSCSRSARSGRRWHEGTPLDFHGEFYRHTLMTPFFNPARARTGCPSIFLAGVGPRMTEMAGEVADGFIVHPFGTEQSLRELTIPAVERGAARAGRDARRHRDRVPAHGRRRRHRRAARAGRDAMRPRLAFYGSTPAYKVILDVHGWGDLQPELNRLSKTGDWATMSSLITDEMVDAFSRAGHARRDRPDRPRPLRRSRAAHLVRHQRQTRPRPRRPRPRRPPRLISGAYASVTDTSWGLRRTCSQAGQAGGSSRSWLTTWALPLPLSSRMTWPMRSSRFFLRALSSSAARYSSTASRVRGEHRVDDRAELARVAHLREAALLDDVARPLVLGHRLGEHVFRLAARDRAVGDEADELGEHLRREHRGREAALVDVARAPPGGPSWRRPSAVPRLQRGDRPLGVVGETGHVDEHARVVVLDAPRPRSSRARRAAGSSGIDARTCGAHLVGRRDRHEVGLGEVAVVVRLFLRAARDRAAAVFVPVAGLLHDALARLRSAPTAARSRTRPRAPATAAS